MALCRLHKRRSYPGLSQKTTFLSLVLDFSVAWFKEQFVFILMFFPVFSKRTFERGIPVFGSAVVLLLQP